MSNKCICTTLRQAALTSTAFYDEMLAPSGLKVTMFRLLRTITAVEDCTITALADTIGLDRSTLGRNLKVLERQGLVKTVATRDGRARAINLTDKGRAALAQAVVLWDAAQQQMAREIGSDLETLMASLARITAITPHKEPHP